MWEIIQMAPLLLIPFNFCGDLYWTGVGIFCGDFNDYKL